MKNDITDAMLKYIGREDLIGIDNPYLHKVGEVWVDHYDCNGCDKCKRIPKVVTNLAGPLNKPMSMDPALKFGFEQIGFLDKSISEFGLHYDPQTIVSAPTSRPAGE